MCARCWKKCLFDCSCPCRCDQLGLFVPWCLVDAEVGAGRQGARVRWRWLAEAMPSAMTTVVIVNLVALLGLQLLLFSTNASRLHSNCRS